MYLLICIVTYENPAINLCVHISDSYIQFVLLRLMRDQNNLCLKN